MVLSPVFVDNSEIPLTLIKIMAEEQTTEVIVTAVAEQITITQPQPDFADQQEIVAQLAKLYPQAFFVDPKQRKPLMIGIFKQLVGVIPDISNKRLRNALGFYCYHFDYLKALQSESHRIDLKGEPAQEIAEDEKTNAEQKLKGSPTTKRKKTKKQTSDTNMAERETLTLKRKPASATTETKSSPVKSIQASGDTVNASAKSAKITLVLESASITRINSEGKKQVKLVVQVGEMKFTAELNSKSYRKALATIDELGADGCNAILQGSMSKFGILEGVGLVVQPKKAKEEAAAETQS